MRAPYYQRGGVTLYHGDVRDIAPGIHRRGFVLFDPPYSARVHKNAVTAGRRKEPLLSGANAISGAAISRKVDLEFDHLTPDLRAFLANTSARLASRWVACFCDAEGLGGWVEAFDSAGIPYRTHAIWRKVGGTPKFTGQECAIPDETIAIAGEAFDPEDTGGHIAFAHRDPNRADGTPRRWWNAGGKLGFYEVNTVLDRGDRPHEKRINRTQKPELLMEALLLDWTDPGECLIDLTAGGCTTLVVAARMGHPVIGVELREDQCESAANRLEALFARPHLIEAAARARVQRWVDARDAREKAAGIRREIRRQSKGQLELFQPVA